MVLGASPDMRRAFTIVELLVVIGIIGMLAALLLPAIQGRGESARRTQCLNNQRQIGIALTNYTSAQKKFPPGAVAKPYPAEPGHPHTFYRWSALAHVLPYLEGGNVYEKLNLSLPMYGPNLDRDAGEQGRRVADGGRVSLPERPSGAGGERVCTDELRDVLGHGGWRGDAV